MNGTGMLVWFGVTVLAALLAWTRAEVRKSSATWLPPLVVLAVSGALLVAITR